MVRLVIPAALRASAQGQREVEADGATLSEVLDDLARRMPVLERRIRDERGLVRPHVLVFVDGVMVSSGSDLRTPVRDGTEVFIAPAVSGGVDGLSTADIVGLLRASGEAIRAEVEALPEEVASWHPAPGEWCVKECLGHLAEAERRGFAGRVRFLLEHGGNPPLTPWDQEAIARARADCSAAAAALLRELLDERAAAVQLVASLRPEDLLRGGEHPLVGHLTVAEVISEWVHHDHNHLKQMLSNVQGYAWRQMGNAQRFSLPH